jgi:hypothetical protein
LGSYALVSGPAAPLKTILELVLWNGLQTDIISIIKMPTFQYLLCLQEQKKVIAG